MDERGNVSRSGTAAVAGGVVLIFLGLLVLPWYRVSSDAFFSNFFAGAGSSASFGEVHDALARFQALVTQQGIAAYVSSGVAGPYFAWLGWVLALLTAVAGGLAVSPVGDGRWTPRWVAAVLAFAGGGVTVTALDLVSFAGNPPPNARPPSFSEFLQQSSFAPWAAVAGYALILGGAFAPHSAPRGQEEESVRFPGVRRR